MGNGRSSNRDFISDLEARVGRIPLSGRYHKAPKKLEDDYDVCDQVLGSGYSGAVRLATRRGDSPGSQKKYAVKAFKLSSVAADKRGQLESEVAIYLCMDHPHITRLFDVYDTNDNLDLVMECMEGGELFDRVHERRIFSEHDAAEASWQMLLAINYIHGEGIVHRDIKLENFLYEKRDSNFLKLIDFGFSKFWDRNHKMEHSYGTMAYVAPEVLAKSYTSQCDMWSFGVIAFILLMGYMPFSGRSTHEITGAIRKGAYVVRKDRWGRLSQAARDFVQRLLVVEPLRRPTASQALEHPWLEQRLLRENGEEVANGTGESSGRRRTFDREVADSLCRFARGSKFRRACMQMMAWSLTLEEHTKLRDLFFELDKERRGTIMLGELKQALKETVQLPESESCMVCEALRDLDSDHDEEVHYSELLAATLSSRVAMHDELVEATFRRFDTENTGYITPESLRQVLGSSVDVGRVIQELDKDHDGKISFVDFVAYLRSGIAEDAHLEAANKVIDQELRHRGGRLRALGRRFKAKLTVPLMHRVAASGG
mmetsp:Transcript_62804/g.174065  ORF Transcript_62804/g.174065 Transcript_62804/m.174065 type:complete len:543 (-) Transcript_62804:168-1796(-)